MARITLTSTFVAFLATTGCGDETPDLGDAPLVDTGADTGATDTGEKPDMGVDLDMGASEMGPADMGATMEAFTTLRNQGPSSQRIDLVFVGDGYTEADLEAAYIQHVEHVTDRIFTRRSNGATEPYYQFRALFNVHRVNLASMESGIDDATSMTTVDSALDGTTGCGGLGNCLPTIDTAKAKAAVDAALMGTDLDADIIFIPLNTPMPLENAIVDANGKFVVYGGGPTGQDDVDTSERALRQLAVAMAGLVLGDSSGGGAYNGPEPMAANLTTSSTGAKWSAWIGFDAPQDDQGPVNAFEGGGGFATGVYRPVNQSKLTGAYPGPYDPVAREAIVHAMFDLVPAVVSQTANSGSLMNPDFIDVTTSIPLVQVRWFVNGMDTMIDGGRIGFVAWAAANGIPAGTHQVEARVSVQQTFRFPDCRRCEFSNENFFRTSTSNMNQTVQYTVIYRP